MQHNFDRQTSFSKKCCTYITSRFEKFIKLLSSQKTLRKTFPHNSHRTSLCRSKFLLSADISLQSLESNRLILPLGRIAVTIFATSFINFSSSLASSEKFAFNFLQANALRCRMQCENLRFEDLC